MKTLDAALLLLIALLKVCAATSHARDSHSTVLHPLDGVQSTDAPWRQPPLAPLSTLRGAALALIHHRIAANSTIEFLLPPDPEATDTHARQSVTCLVEQEVHRGVANSWIGGCFEDPGHEVTTGDFFFVCHQKDCVGDLRLPRLHGGKVFELRRCSTTGHHEWHHIDEVHRDHEMRLGRNAPLKEAPSWVTAPVSGDAAAAMMRRAWVNGSGADYHNDMVILNSTTSNGTNTNCSYYKHTADPECQPKCEDDHFQCHNQGGAQAPTVKPLDIPASVDEKAIFDQMFVYAESVVRDAGGSDSAAMAIMYLMLDFMNRAFINSGSKT